MFASRPTRREHAFLPVRQVAVRRVREVIWYDSRTPFCTKDTRTGRSDLAWFEGIRGENGLPNRTKPPQAERRIDLESAPLVERLRLPDDAKWKPVRDIHQEEGRRGSEAEIVSPSFKRGSHRFEGDFASCERDHRGHDPTNHAAAKTCGAHVDHDRITVAPHLQAVESERPGERLRREGAKVPVPQEERAHLAERANT